jgi:hypothetical protein
MIAVFGMPTAVDYLFAGHKCMAATPIPAQQPMECGRAPRCLRAKLTHWNKGGSDVLRGTQAGTGNGRLGGDLGDAGRMGRAGGCPRCAVRVRGTIERLDGAVYVVKARDGTELKIAAGEKPQIAGIVKASLSDIKKGSFVGVTAMPQADGSLSALEVHIFPEAMRGTGEGHYPWDLQPKSTMTNANVDDVVSAVEGNTLTLKYKDGEKKILVPATAPIVTYVPGDTGDLKPGAKVFIIAVKQPDGTLQGRAWRVGRDGLTPPM